MSITTCPMCGGPAETGPASTLAHLEAPPLRVCYAVIDGDGEYVGIYSTLTLASQAMVRVDHSYVEERELDKLPDEPEPRGEPDYNAPSAAERLERDSFDADRGGIR